MGEEAGLAVFKGFERVGGQLWRAVSGVGGAADVGAACRRDHVVDGGDVAIHYGEAGAVGGVGVEDGVYVWARAQDVEMEAPLGGGFTAACGGLVKAHVDDVLRGHFLVGQGGGGDQHAVAGAD